MSVNRFFQPGRSQRVSQFVPNQLPAEFLMKMAASKQGRQDQARSTMLKQQMEFDQEALIAQDKEYVKGKKQELDSFIGDRFNQDLTQPGQQAEILSYLTNLKKDKGLAAVASHNKDVRRFKEEIRELKKKGLYSSELEEEALDEFNDYVRSGVFDEEVNFSGLSIPELLDKNKKKKTYFDDMIIEKNDYPLAASQFLANNKINLGETFNDSLMKVTHSGIKPERIKNAVELGFPDYVQSAEGKQELMMYNNAVRNGRIDPRRVTPTDYIKNKMLLAGLERAGVSTTFSGLSDINKQLTDTGGANPDGSVVSPEATILFGDKSAFGTKSVTDMIGKEKALRQQGSINAAENLRNSRVRAIAQYNETGGAKMNLKKGDSNVEDLKNPEIDFSSGVGESTMKLLNNPEELRPGSMPKIKEIRDYNKDPYKNVMAAIEKELKNHESITVSEDNILKSLSEYDKKIYKAIMDSPYSRGAESASIKEVLFGASNLLDPTPEIDNLKRGLYSDYVEGLDSHFSEQTLTTVSHKPKDLSEAEDFTDRLNTAKPGEFEIIGELEDADGNVLSEKDIFKLTEDATIAVNPEGSGWISASVNVGTKENPSYRTVALSPKYEGEDGTFMTMAKMISEEFATSMRAGFYADNITPTKEAFSLPGVNMVKGVEIDNKIDAKNAGKFYLNASIGGEDGEKTLTFSDLGTLNKGKLPRLANEQLSSSIELLLNKQDGITPQARENALEAIMLDINKGERTIDFDSSKLESLDIEDPQNLVLEIRNLLNNPYIADNKKQLELMGMSVDAALASYLPNQ